MRIIVSIFFICIFVVYWYYPADWKNRPTGLLEDIAKSEGNVVIPEKEEKSSDLLESAVEQPSASQPAVEQVRQVKQVPVNAPPDNVPDKPPVNKKSDTVKAEKPLSKNKWHVRFGFCLRPSSCVAQQKSLAKKSVQTRIVDGFVMLNRYKTIVGPWPTDTQAEETKTALSLIGVTVHMFTVGTNRYLATASTFSKKLAERVTEKIAEQRYRVSISSKKEKTAVGKVFLDRNFKDRKSAMVELNKFRKKGFDSVVEQEQ